MVFARIVVEKYRLRLRKKVESPDSSLANVGAKITAWKASANR